MALALWNLQSRNAETFRCCQANGLAGSASTFTMTAITPVNTAYVDERTNFSSAFSSALDLQTLRVVRKPTRIEELQRSLSTV